MRGRYGLVYGNTIRARHLGNDILAALKGLIGGEISEYTKMMAEAREQAVDRMKASAANAGANAIVNVRFTTAYVMRNAAEILAYGDAVTLENGSDAQAARVDAPALTCFPGLTRARRATRSCAAAAEAARHTCTRGETPDNEAEATGHAGHGTMGRHWHRPRCCARGGIWQSGSRYRDRPCCRLRNRSGYEQATGG